MFLRIVRESFSRGKRRKVIAMTAVALGTAVATALVNVAMSVGDKVGRELRAYGANLVVVPEEAELPVEVPGVEYRPIAGQGLIEEGQLPRIKDVFWRHNILGFAPTFSAVVEVAGTSRRITLTGAWFEKPVVLSDGTTMTTGLRAVSPFWSVRGAWSRDGAADPEGMVGADLARRLRLRIGDRLAVRYNTVTASLRVVGIVTTGGPEDAQAFTQLNVVQRLTGRPGGVNRVYVSALTNPDDALARRNPKEMTREEYDRWYCTPYVGSIALQLQEALPGTEAKPIRQIAQSEGAILSRVQGLMLAITLAALFVSGLGVMSTMTTTVLERRTEIGLLKAIGAGNWGVAGLFLAEALIIGLLGGLVGYGLGFGLAQVIGRSVFGSAILFNGTVIPLSLIAAVLMTLAGSALPVRRALRIDPVMTLQR